MERNFRNMEKREDFGNTYLYAEVNIFLHDETVVDGGNALLYNGKKCV